jgi:NAD(P)-dependent dehydrogenase (short-subunit alcohol dehydrogenase family)
MVFTVTPFARDVRTQDVDLIIMLTCVDTETAIFADTTKIHDADNIRAKHPLHGTGTPKDLVGAAVFLASQEARWITGVCLPVDGGYTAQ